MSISESHGEMGYFISVDGIRIFTMALLQDSWDFIKDDLCEVLESFTREISWKNPLLGRFSVLYPRRLSVSWVKDFRPISFYVYVWCYQFLHISLVLLE